MRYQVEIDIELPRDRVVELFLNPDNLVKWQPDLVRFEPMNDTVARDVGAQTRQVHKMGKRDVEIIETITTNDHPEAFSATYEGDGVTNAIDNRFVDIGPHKTRWVLVSEFKCRNVVMKLMTLLLPGMFKQQSLKFMNQFKAFAEQAGGR